MNKKLKISNLKKVIFSFVFLIILLIYNFASSASIIDDIKNTFGIRSESTINSEKTNHTSELIGDELKESLTDNEKRVVEQIENTVNSIRQVDIDKIWSIFGNSLKGLNKNDTSEFFNEYPKALDSLKRIIAKIFVKINDIKTENEKIIVNISIEHPSITQVVKTIMPEVLLKNAGAFIDNNITNENINSILNSIGKAVDNSSISLEKIDFNIEFKEVNGNWIITNGDKIVRDLENHFNTIKSQITKNIR